MVSRFHVHTLLVMVAWLAWLGPEVRAQNLLQNGSFELGSWLDNSMFSGAMTLENGSTNMVGWVVGKGSGNFWWMQKPNYSAEEGTRFVDLDSNEFADPSSYVEQTFATTPGWRYRVSGWFGSEGNKGAMLSVKVNGVEIGVVDCSLWSGVPDSPIVWTNASFVFTAESTNTTLRLEDANTNSFYNAIIDNVSVEALAVPGYLRLPSTGVDEAGAVLPVHAVDPHYAVSGAASAGYVVPVYSIMWMENPAGAAWIGPNTSDDSGAYSPMGLYHYTLTFDLAGMDPAKVALSGAWTADDGGQIYLNGAATGITNGPWDFAHLSGFVIRSGFVPGTNTLDFQITNGPPAEWGNPSGLMVADLMVTNLDLALPVITAQPSSRTNEVGTLVTFSVSASGSAPLAYQWYFNEVALPGQTGETLRLTNVQPANAGAYCVVVANAYGSATSSNAWLSLVAYPPTITAQPKSATVVAGQAVAFSVTASGSGRLYYQWYFNGVAMPGRTSDSMAWKSVQLSDAGAYFVVVTNAYGSASSSNAVLTVLPAPTCVPPPEGLVAWWRAESNYLDSAGLNDVSAQQGPIAFTAGKVGRSAFSFSQNGYVVAAASDSLDVGGQAGLSIEGWIRPGSVSSPFPMAEWNDGRGNIGAGLMIAPQYGPGVLAGFLTDTNTYPIRALTLCSPSRALTNGVWQHVALTLNASNGLATLYVNGLSVAQTNVGAPPAALRFRPATTAPFYLGYRASGSYGGRMYYGGLDEFSVYNRALSSDEVMSIVQADGLGKCVAPPVCVPVPAGIVGWWRGQSNALDSVSTNNGQTNGAVTYGPGELGAGFVFNGGYLRMPAPADLDVGAGLTVELWMKPASLSPMALVDLMSGTNVQGVGLSWSTYGPSDLAAVLLDTAGVVHIARTPVNITPTYNNWQHVALTYDKASGMAALYCNGLALVQTNLGVFTPRTSNNLFVGYRPPGSYQGSGMLFRGAMDELAIYNRALTAAELRAIAVAGAQGKCAEAPWIYSQPVSQRVWLGLNVTLSVGAAGTPNLRYQWQVPGHRVGEIPGANGSSLTITNIQAIDWGSYSVRISNGFGAVTSAVVQLYPNRAPLALATNAVVAAGSDCAAQVTVDNGSFDADGDEFTLTQAPPGPYPLGTNRVMLTARDSYGASTSTNVLVIVLDQTRPMLTCPADIVVTNGHESSTTVVTYSAEAWDNCSGACTPVFSPPSGAHFRVGTQTVWVSATDAAGNVTQGSFRVTVLPGNVPPVPNIEVAPLAQFPNRTNLMVIAPDGRKVLVYFDASWSYDPDDASFLYSWSKGTNIFSTAVVAANLLSHGTNTITLRLSDTHPGGVSSASVDVVVMSPAEAVDIILELVGQSGLSQKRQQPLLAALRAARGSFAHDQFVAGAVQLYAFRFQVRAQVERQNPALAGSFIEAADQILRALVSPLTGSRRVLTFHWVKRGEDGRFRIRFDGPAAQVRLVQASADLLRWETIGLAHDNGDGTFDFEDAAAGRTPSRSYRVVAP